MVALALLACAHREPAPLPAPAPAVPTVWVAAPAPVSMGPAAPLSLRFSGAQLPAYVEVNCDTGFRERASLVGDRADFPAVPLAVPCLALPKGVVATSVEVKGGHAWACEVVGTTTACESAAPSPR